MTALHAIQTIASLAEAKGGPSRVLVGLSTPLVAAGVATDLIAGTTPADGAVLLPDPG